jgi:cbb3-type cytochrome oxidase subunit 1
VTATGGVLFTIGAFFFVYNMWRTFDAADARHREPVKPASGGRGLPTLGE